MRELNDLLDDRGVLLTSRWDDVRLTRPLLVFLQRKTARIDVGQLSVCAARNFDTRLGLMVPKRYEGAAGELRDLTLLAVAPPGRDATPVTILTRLATPADHALALALEEEQGGGGLGLLARRCEAVAEVDSGAGDELALRVAAIFAQAHLGPVVAPAARQLFGVKTARERLLALRGD